MYFELLSKIVKLLIFISCAQMTVRNWAISANSLFKCKTADEILSVYAPAFGLHKDVSLQQISGRGSSSTSCGQYQKPPAKQSSPPWTWDFVLNGTNVQQPLLFPWCSNRQNFLKGSLRGSTALQKCNPVFQWQSQPPFYRGHIPFILHLHAGDS